VRPRTTSTYQRARKMAFDVVALQSIGLTLGDLDVA
jgi:hypothetical protein